MVAAPPLFIQEKVQPKVLIDDLMRRPQVDQVEQEEQLDLFADFNGLPSGEAATEFYQHDANWSNRMILGDSLQVMASLAEREGLRGKVQCIYVDPPYGIRFNSNFQWSTTSRDVRDGKADHITREPEQVKAFRDTWRDGIHSYLTYLRDRLTVARDLLTESGSIFVQIGDENVHRVRALMDEVFGGDNFVSEITFVKNSGQTTSLLSGNLDYILWFARKRAAVKYRQLFYDKSVGTEFSERYDQLLLSTGVVRALKRGDRVRAEDLPDEARLFALQPAISAGFNRNTTIDYALNGTSYFPGANRQWKYTKDGMDRLAKAARLVGLTKMIYYRRFVDDFPAYAMGNNWNDTQDRLTKSYVVQTVPRVLQRCILMTTDPGDLVVDPTCGSGTTAYVAEQWGRRWITIDTSRVALALARARIMGARYLYYLLSDSPEGKRKAAEVTSKPPSDAPTYNDVRQGFVYERVPHITLREIANNSEIDVIWEKHEERLASLREQLNSTLGTAWEEWEVPRDAADAWPEEVRRLHADWWQQHIARQKEIDASIAAKADFEYLYDKPHEDNQKVRVAGPFTVDSLSPHRVLGVDENDELIDSIAEAKLGYSEKQDFAGMILEHLKTSGVQQAHKEDRISFTGIRPWPGDLVCAEGTYLEGDAESGAEKRAAIFIGPEFGTVSRPDLVQAAREAADAGYDVLIACAFNYEAHSTDFEKLGRVPVLKARMNADLHMADDLKNTGKGNLFVIFGEPDIDVLDADNGQIRVKVKGVDVFHPNTGEILSDNADDIACWFVDTDYNEESFFVRHAYFLGANDPYKALKTTLKAEINREAWETLHSDTSRPFDKPASGRIAVKVINHLGDEVMKVFRV